MIVFCEYGGLEYDCSLIFETILTDDGVCCIFNPVHKKYVIAKAYQ